MPDFDPPFVALPLSELVDESEKKQRGRPRKLTDEERAQRNRERVKDWRVRQKKNMSPRCTEAMRLYVQWKHYVIQLEQQLLCAKTELACAKQYWKMIANQDSRQEALDAAVGKGEPDNAD